MLGRPAWVNPVFIWKRAGAWLLLSACMERITQRLSAWRARFGYVSAISIPDCPCFANWYGLAIATFLVFAPVHAAGFLFAGSHKFRRLPHALRAGRQAHGEQEHPRDGRVRVIAGLLPCAVGQIPRLLLDELIVHQHQRLRRDHALDARGATFR